MLHPDDWLVQVGWLGWAWQWLPAEQQIMCGYNSMERRPLPQAWCMVTGHLLETRFNTSQRVATSPAVESSFRSFLSRCYCHC